MPKPIVLAACLAGLLFSASCSTTDVLPYSDSRIADDGSYPNLNLVPEAAAPPLGTAEARSTIAAVESAKPAQRAAPTSDSEALRLRRLGQTHAQDALRQIEASGN